MRRSHPARRAVTAAAILALALLAASCTDTLLLASIKATNDVATFGAIPSPTVTPPASPWGTQVFAISEAATTGTGAAVTTPSFTYTTDGTTPTRSSTSVSGGTISLAASAANLKVLAFVPEWPESTDAVTEVGAVKVFDLRMIVQKYVASNYSYQFWDNGTAIDIGAVQNSVNAWVEHNGVYYIAGSDSIATLHAGYWTSNDGVYHSLDSGGAEARTIAVDSNGVIYVGGYDASNHPTYWTVVGTTHTGTHVIASATAGVISSFVISGSSLYIGGGLPGGHDTVGTGTYWIPTVWVDATAPSGVPTTGDLTPISLPPLTTATGSNISVSGESVVAMGLSNGELLAYARHYAGASDLPAVWSIKATASYDVHGPTDVNSLAGHPSGWSGGMWPNGGVFLGSTLYLYGGGSGSGTGHLDDAVLLPITQNVGSAPTTDDANIKDFIVSGSNTMAFSATLAGGTLYVGGYNGYQQHASIWIGDAAHQFNITSPANLVSVAQIDVKVR
jgi:hypothetical protein